MITFLTKQEILLCQVPQVQLSVYKLTSASAAFALGPVTLVAANSNKPCGKIQDLSKECFSHLFKFLTAKELATWRDYIGTKDQTLWKKQCDRLGLIQATDCIIRVKTPAPNSESFMERVLGRCWHGNPPPEVQYLPTNLPLRLFVKKNGSFKNNGDEIQVIWKGQKLILTIQHRPELRDDVFPCNDFRAAAIERVRISLLNGMFTEQELAEAKAKAAIAGEWIDSE